MHLHWQGMYENDFLGLTFKNYMVGGTTAIGPPLTGKYIVEKLYEIETTRGKWANLVIVFGMVLGYRVIFFLMIKLRENLRPFLNSLVAKRATTKMARRVDSPVQNNIPPISSKPSPLHETAPLRLSGKY